MDNVNAHRSSPPRFDLGVAFFASAESIAAESENATETRVSLLVCLLFYYRTMQLCNRFNAALFIVTGIDKDPSPANLTFPSKEPSCCEESVPEVR